MNSKVFGVGELKYAI